ncbi:hypothetical protein G7Z17_g4532 [Cylindrodendrum hubeiense]|uniref:Ankyrin repeat protein n=1 Tax=Cylindrodendrum hubeiense TaxID=595255 RepID=A0A9P5HCM2_9HYPO|nr:hypothetical protein G7Z17_g4532 [Cylindrodendrum hubeiense]
MEAILLLLSYGADINAPAGKFSGRTALQAAASAAKLVPCFTREFGHFGLERLTYNDSPYPEIVELLLLRQADVNASAAKEFGRTALQAATSSECPDPRIVTLLLDHGADVNAAPAEIGGVTALQGAAIKGDMEIAKILLKHKADVNAAPALKKGRTAMEGAAEHGRMDMVRWLINSGAEPDPVNGLSRAIELADENEHFFIVILLQDVEEFYESKRCSDLLNTMPWSLLPDRGMVMNEEEEDGHSS